MFLLFTDKRPFVKDYGTIPPSRVEVTRIKSKIAQLIEERKKSEGID